MRVALADGTARVFHPMKKLGTPKDEEILLTHGGRRVYRSAPYFCDGQHPSFGPVVCGKLGTLDKVNGLDSVENLENVFVHNIDEYPEEPCAVTRLSGDDNGLLVQMTLILLNLLKA